MLAAVLGPVMQMSLEFLIAITLCHHTLPDFKKCNDFSGQTPLLVVFSGGIKQLCKELCLIMHPGECFSPLLLLKV